MDINKVNEAVKLKMQIQAMTKKLEAMIYDFRQEEYGEYIKRVSK